MLDPAEAGGPRSQQARPACLVPEATRTRDDLRGRRECKPHHLGHSDQRHSVLAALGGHNLCTLYKWREGAAIACNLEHRRPARPSAAGPVSREPVSALPALAGQCARPVEDTLEAWLLARYADVVASLTD